MQLPVDPERYIAYLAITASMCFFPGPANTFAVATGLKRGHAAALTAAAGMGAANVAWFAAAALGLGVLMATFPQAFRALAYLGAAYLLWLAWRTWRARDRPGLDVAGARQAHGAFADGFGVQITNPKALLFITAVLPPFLDVGRAIAPQLLMFAIPALLIDAAAMATYGLGGAAFSRQMQSPRFRRGFALVSALLLICAAALVILGA